MIETIRKLMAPLNVRIVNMLARAVVSTIDDSQQAQLLKLAILDGETRDEIERLQNYGFTSHPKSGAEAFVAFVGGRRDHGVALVVEDRRYRIVNLESGEVAVYDHTGSKILLRQNGNIELTPSSGVVSLTGDLNVSGTVTGSTDVVGGGKSLKNHTHSGTSLTGTGACAAGGGALTITGSTAAPS